MALFALFTVFAAALWFVMFSPWTKASVPFWPMMTVSALLLTAGALLVDRKKLRGLFTFKIAFIPIGLASAVALYAIFFVGGMIAVKILPFAGSQIANVYGPRSQLSPTIIAMLLFFCIGPAEEVFWRGFIQRRLHEKFSTLHAIALSTLLYTIVHIWSFNLMLIAAAAICGAFWAIMFAKYRSLWPVIISHAVWDVLIFIILPVQ